MRVKLFDSEDKAKEVLADNIPRLIRANNLEICIVRKGEQLFAFQDACTHMAEGLHKGTTNYLNEIVCPLHTYRFNMNTGEESDQRCASLKVYPIEYTANGIFLDV